MTSVTVCVSMKAYLAQIRDCISPGRNGLFHATVTRNAVLTEDLFWTVLVDIKEKYSEFLWDSSRSFWVIAVAFQTGDPCCRFHDHSTDCEVHELGETLSAKSGGENALGLEILSVEFFHSESCERFRSENGVSTLCSDR